MWLDHRFFETKSLPQPSPEDANARLPEARNTPRKTMRKVRATPGERLLRAVLELAGREVVLVSHAERPWASVTFHGSRQTFVLRFHGWEACDGAEHLIAQVPEHEFTLPGLLVADAVVVRADQMLLPCPHMEVELEILLLEDN
ncbi:hypothetical protein [Novosphingobium sp.]|uniref:hypothetical protein n=1 Tax=Novosphingobium sp. TaxID=1874826 RepID=UPI0038B98A00